MVSHSSATAHEHTPFNSTTNNSLNQIAMRDALKRRAEFLIHDKSIDGSTRSIIRYALEIDDPMLLELVERVEVGGTIGDNLDEAQVDTVEEKIEALTEIICETGDRRMRTAALVVLMASVKNADDSKAFANTAKHCALTWCVEMNLYGIVDAHVEMLQRNLFA